MIVGQSVKFATNLAANIWLARLLTPADFGVVGMAITVVTFLGIVRDMGITSVSLQATTLTHDDATGLFWVQMAFTAALTLLLLAGVPLIGHFYRTPALVPILVVSALGFFLGGFGIQPQAMLVRDLRLGVTVRIEMVVLFVGVALCLSLALAQWGAWALVISGTASGILSLGLTWWASGWHPGRPRWDPHILPLLRSGAWLNASSILNYFARNGDDILIGRVFGATALGFYSRAYGLLLMPLQQVFYPLAGVAQASLRHLVDDPPRFREAYRRVVEPLVWLAMPGVAFLMVTADQTIPLLFGSQWGEVVVLFRWLGIFGLLQPVCVTTGWVMLAQRRVKDVFWWYIFATGITLVSFVAGLPWGVRGVAAGYALASALVVAPALFFWTGRRGAVSARDLWHLTFVGAVPSVAVAAAAAVVRVLGPAASLPNIACGAAAAGCALIAITAGTSTGRRIFVQAREAVRLQHVVPLPSGCIS